MPPAGVLRDELQQVKLGDHAYRLLALEAQLGVELYRKSRGPRRTAVLTDQGRRFLPHALAFALVGLYAPASFLSHFTVFVLACFVGYMVVWNVTPSLHTPLMSVTNAISSIIAVGALVQVAPPLVDGAVDRPGALILGLAVLALALTAVNMFGGFAVTRRMLAMFRK